EFSEGGLVYIDYSGDTTFKDRFRRLFKIMVTRNSERFLNGEEKNHSLLADFYVVDLKEKMVYILSFQDPIFVSSENNELSMAVKDEDFIFAKETLEIEEIEYEMSLDEENEVDEEQEEKIEKGDLLSNDDILDTSNYIEF
ncbi:hypothetical protein IKQ26_06260, partial [bacterium]|nr:hypothetical protein [bacterium]